MTPSVILVAMALLAVTLVLTLALWLRRRHHVRWTTWLWGALAFILSQAVRIPLLAGTGPAASALGLSVIAAVTAVALITSGVCEEGSRWVVLRFWARRDRTRPDGLMFGAGHGGIEALILFGGSVAGGLVLLATGDAVLEQAPPDQVGAITAQLESLRSLTPGLAFLGVWERIQAMVFHVAATLAVLRAVRERRPALLVAAMVAHITFNGIAVLTLQLTHDTVLTEVAVTACGAFFLWGILRGWGAPRHFVEPAVGVPAGPGAARPTEGTTP